MSIFDGMKEMLGGGKRNETATQISLEEKKQDLANLEALMSQGKDFRSPADATRAEQLRQQIKAAESPSSTPILSPTAPDANALRERAIAHAAEAQKIADIRDSLTGRPTGLGDRLQQQKQSAT